MQSRAVSAMIGATPTRRNLGPAREEGRLLEHDGGHVDRLGERIETRMLPFFSEMLRPEAADGAVAPAVPASAGEPR